MVVLEVNGCPGSKVGCLGIKDDGVRINSKATAAKLVLMMR
jgi:hypothetical protein